MCTGALCVHTVGDLCVFMCVFMFMMYAYVVFLCVCTCMSACVLLYV